MMNAKNKQPKRGAVEAATLVVQAQPFSIAAEQFRTIRTNLRFTMVDKKVKSIVVTSANASSGKSFVAANLAATFAAENKKVLLVDADLRKPTVHRIFGIRNFNGLTTLLTEESIQLEHMVHYSLVSNLFVLPSGALPPNPAELLSSHRMDVLKAQMEEEYDLVIFDMPPILPVADAQIMAGKTDGTIFVIPQGGVSKEEGKKAKQLLEMVQANILGAVMNRVEPEKDSYYYYGEKTDPYMN
ncbi:CpsD/CapB family tyrosine-protein kinase [Atopococcus tabaci]|uniref:CpsD/CapB family tyrosine-protein kinase n=1 Tax=Atopococcus tabaci TaxID=269774 RepID=UPI000401C1CE|nr:CpsD/CapB family tyrosine-protein kinase [Atopococcus tabaci]